MNDSPQPEIITIEVSDAMRHFYRMVSINNVIEDIKDAHRRATRTGSTVTDDDFLNEIADPVKRLHQLVNG